MTMSRYHTKHLVVYVTDEEHALTTAAAQALGISKMDLIRRSLHAFLRCDERADGVGFTEVRVRRGRPWLPRPEGRL